MKFALRFCAKAPPSLLKHPVDNPAWTPFDFYRVSQAGLLRMTTRLAIWAARIRTAEDLDAEAARIESPRRNAGSER
jgi:hypothetical protein